MQVLSIVLVSLFSLLVLFLLTKLMGCKQMSQLSLFDYIIGISIGSIAAEMATDPSADFWQPLLAMSIYGGVAFLISLVNNRFRGVRRIISGSPLVLMEKGEIYRRNMKKARMDLGEFLTECRGQGYFDLSAIDVAVLEPNGHLSIWPCSTERPVTPNDLSLPVKRQPPGRIVVMDGEVLTDNLQAAGYDEKWLTRQLSEQNLPPVNKLFLAELGDQGKLNVYAQHREPHVTHQFE